MCENIPVKTELCSSCHLYYGHLFNHCTMCFLNSNIVVKDETTDKIMKDTKQEMQKKRELEIEQIKQDMQKKIELKNKQKTEFDIILAEEEKLINIYVDSVTLDAESFSSMLDFIDKRGTGLTSKQMDIVLKDTLNSKNKKLSWNQALEIYINILLPKFGTEYNYEYDHVICSKVANYWKIDRDITSVGCCYYNHIYMATNTYDAPRLKDYHI